MKQSFKILIVACGVVASTGAMIGPAARGQAQSAPASKQLFQSDLKGVPGQEALVFFVEFAPGQGLPWHVHPGGHELVYGLEGTFVFEEQNGTKSSLKAGDIQLQHQSGAQYMKQAPCQIYKKSIVDEFGSD